eukprot:1221550-Rhodomonas_salina.2
MESSNPPVLKRLKVNARSGGAAPEVPGKRCTVSQTEKPSNVSYPALHPSLSRLYNSNVP